MSGAEEEWVKAAITDDTIVVELLMRLHAAAPPPPPLLLKRATLPLEWTVRQRRSKPVLANTNPKKPAQSQRASPTTPLSWSGATSISGGSGGAGGGGSEESSRPHIQKVARSKVNGDSEKTVSKRSRKKKTLAELKDEESSLLKERRELKRKLDALCMNLEKQRAKNENLKRMKIELQPLPDREITSVADKSISHQLQPKTTSSSPISPLTPPIVLGEAATLQSSTSNGCSEANAGAASDSTFVLPDLNIPFEEDPCPDVIRGIS